MSRFRTTDQADEDLIAIYIQGYDQFGPQQAERYQDGLEAAFQRLADYPALTRLRTEFNPPVRAFSYMSHVIFYEEEPGGVVILRLRHGHEDWQGHLGDRLEERGEP